MPLSVLNNISSLTAENSLSLTQAKLQKTLTQLSTGLKINNGSDDSAGLSIAQGLEANIAALTQSQQNANNGVGLLQTTDGALSQVTTLLNRAVTLATEASSSNITTGSGSQAVALDNEFQSILNEVNQIGTNTNFNGQNVFTSNAPTAFTSTQGSLSAATTLTTGSKTTISDNSTGGTFIFTAAAGDTIATLQTAISGAVTNGTLSAATALSFTAGKAVIAEGGTQGINVTSNDAVLGPFSASAPAAGNTNTVFISDGTSTTNLTITTSINQLSATALSLNTNSLTSAANAQTALTAINAAINSISAQRGAVGASVNRLQAVSNVINTQVENLQSADNSIQNADIGKTVANLTQFNILQSTGISALQQSNQAQQSVLKLLQ